MIICILLYVLVCQEVKLNHFTAISYFVIVGNPLVSAIPKEIFGYIAGRWKYPSQVFLLKALTNI